MRAFLPTWIVVFASLAATGSWARAGSTIPIPIIITELRTSGPGITSAMSASDEFVELCNDSEMPHTVMPVDGSSGYAVVASDGTTRFIIPRGTVIQPRQHFLGVNSAGYSLSNGGTTAGDASYTTDIPFNAGVAVFATSDPSQFSVANRLDAVGPSTEANALYRKGTGYAPIADPLSQHAVVRTAQGIAIDTGDNAHDFVIVFTTRDSGNVLGAPGPESMFAPISPSFHTLTHELVDPVATDGYGGNTERDDTPNDGSRVDLFGNIWINRYFVNSGASPLTSLRFRIESIGGGGMSDLRALTSMDHVVTTASGPVALKGVRLEEPPAQEDGGGINSTLVADSVTAANPLMPGESIALSFRFGIMFPGQSYVIRLTAGGEPAASNVLYTSARSSSSPFFEVGSNTGPVAADDSFYTGAVQYITVSAPGVLTNDSGIGLDAQALLTRSTEHGIVSLGKDGSFTYTATQGYRGTDSFRYRAFGLYSAGNEATVAIDVGGNTPPTGRSERYSLITGHTLVTPAPGVLANDDDAESHALQVVLVSQPQHGAFAWNGDGSFSYSPAAGFIGADSFAYRVSDGDLQSSIVFDVIDVFVEGALSVGGPFLFATSERLAVTAPGLLSGALGSAAAALTAIARDPGPAHGTVSINSDGSFVYLPSDGFIGTDAFAFGIQDTSGQSAWGMASIRVVPASQSLAIVKTHSEYFSQGRVGATYTINITNVGALPTTGIVSAVDTMPAGLTGTAISGDDWTCTLATLTCRTAALLAPGHSYSPIAVVANVSNTSPPSVTNRVTVYTGDGTVPIDEFNDITPINQIATDLTITQSIAAPLPFGGQNVTYTLIVANAGPAVATHVIVKDVLPPGTRLVSSMPSGLCGGSDIISCSVGTLVNGSSATVALVVATPVAGGKISNVASVSSLEPDTQPENNSSSSAITLEAASAIPALSELLLLLLLCTLVAAALTRLT